MRSLLDSIRNNFCHCEKKSDEAISSLLRDCRAPCGRSQKQQEQYFMNVYQISIRNLQSEIRNYYV